MAQRILKLQGTTITYPADMRQECPDTILPARDLSQAELNEVPHEDGISFFIVQEVAAPAASQLRTVAEGQPEPHAGGFRQVWNVTTMAQQDAAADVVREIDIKAKALRDLVVVNVSPAEMASWPIKRAEALAATDDGDAQRAPMLSLEAMARGIPVMTLVEKVVAKATALSQLEAAIAGECGRRQDQARAANTIDALEAILVGVDAGWPV